MKRLAIVAGEHSGDQLAAALMGEINARTAVTWRGVGGEAMVAQGLSAVFPMAAVSVNGFDAIVRQRPALLRRIGEAAHAVAAFAPDGLIIVDAPEFSHRVARRVRKALPGLPVVNLVSPTVWAWRPGRATAMRAYVDRVLCLFPFEVEAHRRLGGPPATYVGHPLFEAMRRTAPAEGDSLLVLPGSRRGEVERLMDLFGAAAGAAAGGRQITVLAVEHLRDRIEALAEKWPQRPVIISGPDAKTEAFAGARAALAASGTVTFELSAAQVPMAVAYRLDGIGKVIKALHPVFPIVKAQSMALTNIILGREAVPTFLDEEGSPEALAGALQPLLSGGPQREAQLAAFGELQSIMHVERPPAAMAADAVLE
ncbi:MAG: lipid-A-disaccharide synthase, partial [Pseudomonadota bacterium]